MRRKSRRSFMEIRKSARDFIEKQLIPKIKKGKSPFFILYILMDYLAFRTSAKVEPIVAGDSLT